MLFTEAKLRAYAGNELDAPDVGALEDRMAAEPDLARRAVLALLQHRLGAPAAGPAMLARGALAANRAAPAARAQAPAPHARPGPWNAWPIGAGMAAALLLIGIGYFAGRETVPGAGMIGVGDLRNAALQTALERVPTGGVENLRDGRFRAVASFITADGSLCRQFSLTDRSGAGNAVACRRGKAWAVTFALLEPSGGADYAPADGDDPIGTYLQGLGASRPLAEPAEKDLLQGSP